MDETYDLAFSFAGEDRPYVEAVKKECEKLDIKVYYDQDRKIDQWGLNLIQEQRTVYSGYKTKYFVPFISEHYFNKPMPTDEFKAALDNAIKQDGYILPVKLDDSETAAKYMHPHTQYLKATDYSPEELAKAFKEKLDKGGKAENVDDKLATELRLPKIKVTPRNYNPYDDAEALLRYIERQFRANLAELSDEGYITNVRSDSEKIIVRIQKDREQVFALNVFFAQMGGEASLGYNFDGQSMMANTNSYSGYVEPKFNTDTGVAGYIISDFASNDAIVSSEEVVKFLWDQLKEAVEGHSKR